ncbi:MAG: hypothetical protein ACTHU0_21915 [Kofleriaceae bacterium]
MGYTTEFDGEFAITPTLKPEHRAYLAKFDEVRHMKRDPQEAGKMSDPVREAAGLPVGPNGDHYVGSTEYCGQDSEGEGGG